jgi:hypothetical protein
MKSVKPPLVSHGSDEQGSFTRIVGTEVIGEILASTDFTAPGDVLNIVYLNPMMLRNTRVRVISTVFLKYKLEHASLEYQSVTASIAQGGLIIVPVNDPEVSFSTSSRDFSTVTRAMNFENAIGFNVYNNVVCHFPRDVAEDPYFLKFTDEPRFSFPGTFYVISQTEQPPIASETERTLGIISLHYSFKFYHQVLRIEDISFPSGEHVFTGSTPAGDFFQYGPSSIEAHEPVRLNRSWFVGSAGALKPGQIGEITIYVDFTASSPLTEMIDAYDQVYNFTAGTILYARETWVDGERCIALSPTMTFHDAESGLYYNATALTPGVITGGAYTIRIFPIE